MQFQPGAISLSAISGGTLASGVIPFPRFTRDYQQAENAGVVTVTAGTVELASVTITGAQIGDRLLILARIDMQKGDTAGDAIHAVDRPAGPGQLNFMLQGAWHDDRISELLPFDVWEYTLSCFAEVTTAGAMTLRSYASSFGSNGSVNTGGAGLSVWLFAGS